MSDAAEFPFVSKISTGGTPGLMPWMPIRLSIGTRSVDTEALLDTGASVNVLPFDLGLQLGAVWEQQTVPLVLTGNLARWPARALLLRVHVANFAAATLAFAWTQATDAPLLLGQVNFFKQFNVCFFGSQSYFEVRPTQLG